MDSTSSSWLLVATPSLGILPESHLCVPDSRSQLCNTFAAAALCMASVHQRAGAPGLMSAPAGWINRVQIAGAVMNNRPGVTLTQRWSTTFRPCAFISHIWM